MTHARLVGVAILVASIAAVPAGAMDRTIAGQIRVEGDIELLAPLVGESISITGTIRGPPTAPLVIQAKTIELLPTGRLLAANGISAPEDGPIGAAGADGQGVIIRAERFVMHAGSAIVAGTGGAGAHARSPSFAVGGEGGRGGDVWVEAWEYVIDGDVYPGGGGNGGDAVVVAANLALGAVGGDGGSSGLYFVNAALVSAHQSNAADVLPAVGCSVAVGEAGTNGGLAGKGGDGGDACIEVTGGNGENGADGNDGPFECSAGGKGTDGTSVTAGSATGGKGGAGFMEGGRGGNASSTAKAGDGGNGGVGGTGWFVPNCPGGAGGNAGNAATGTTNGGPGGESYCGEGGQGGVASSTAEAGKAGAGGQGDPPGEPGLPGRSDAGAQNAGLGGPGLNICNNRVP